MAVLMPFNRTHMLGLNVKADSAATMDRPDMAPALEWLENTGNGATLFSEDRKTVLGVLGAVPTLPGICEVFVIPSKEQAAHPHAFARAVRAQLYTLKPKFRRIQAVAKIDSFHARWLSWLGFVCEGTLRKYGTNGEDMNMWSLT